MIKIILSTVLLLGIMSCSSDQKVVNSQEKAISKTVNTAAPGIDISKSTIRWSATKAIGGGHQGMVSFKEGDINWENGVPKDGFLVIDLNTITCTDIKDAESNNDLVDHLKSSDFFAVEKFPTIYVKMLDFSPTKESQYQVPSDMTVRNLTKRVVADVKLSDVNGQKIIKGFVEINRTEFGIIYNSSNFFKSLGDKVIDDNIKLRFNIVLK